MSNSNDNNLMERISIRGVFINLADVSHDLQRKYRAASAAAARSDKARAQLNEIGEAILAEQCRPSQAKRLLTPTSPPT